jgi:hypothetical protein
VVIRSPPLDGSLASGLVAVLAAVPLSLAAEHEIAVEATPF